MPNSPTPNWNGVTVRWRGMMIDGEPAQGTIVITATVNRFLDDDAALPSWIFNGPIEVDINVNGYAEIILPATDDPDIYPRNFTYQIFERLEGATGSTYYINVPLSAAASGIELSRVVPVEPSEGVGTYSPSYTHNVLILNETDPVPPGTPAGILVLRTA